MALEDTIFNPDDGEPYRRMPQIPWLSLIKGWVMLFLLCLSAVTLLVMLVAGVRVIVWRVRGDGGPLLQRPTTPSVNSSSQGTAEEPSETLPSLSPATVPTLSFKLVIPVAGVRPDQLRDTYTDARSEGRVHNSIDIMAARGTPVVAAADGQIVKLVTSDRGGISIYQIASDQKTVLYYAHLDHYADGLSEGKSLQLGETIGYVGDTGNATPGSTHLHFAIWIVADPKHFWNGETINPYPLLRQDH